MNYLDDKTPYDIGVPFMTVRFNGGTLSHTPNGIVLNIDSGTRYTCSYKRLISLMKANSKNYTDFIEETNINDIVDQFERRCKKMLLEAENRNKEIINNLND